MPWVFLRLLWKSRKVPEYRKRWAERLGFTPHRLEKCIWVHAVSVGETIAAVPLIAALKKAYPDIPLLVTNMTPTGAARVKAAFKSEVVQCYVPYDLPGAMLRFINRIHPMICIVMETELWPNQFAICKAKHIPIVVTNARLSEKSAHGYQRIHFLTNDMLKAVSKLASQGRQDAERFIALGMPKENVVVTGNLKFDLVLPADLTEKKMILRKELGENRLIWIAASTHPGEEEIIIAAHKKIRSHCPNALLILVPRHPDRFDEVAAMTQQHHLQMARRSLKEMCSNETAVYLGDTMGEMLLLYSVCDVAFVAGSFAKIGGHNVLEAAALEKPIITGPHLHNFAEISQMLQDAKGMFVVQNEDELADKIIQFFADENERKKIGENALRVVEENRGSLVKQMDVIQSVLVKSSTTSPFSKAAIAGRIS